MNFKGFPLLKLKPAELAESGMFLKSSNDFGNTWRSLRRQLKLKKDKVHTIRETLIELSFTNAFQVL